MNGRRCGAVKINYVSHAQMASSVGMLNAICIRINLILMLFSVLSLSMICKYNDVLFTRG